MFPIILQTKWITISSYGVMLAIALFVGLHVAQKNAKTLGFDPKRIESFSMWLIVVGVLGSRFLYTFVEHPDQYLSKPFKFFAFQEGGLSFTGGLIFSIVLTVVYCFKNKINFFKLADTLSPSVAIGFSIAKIGCFLTGCCHGKVCDLPWAVVYTNPQSNARPLDVGLHPSQIYESIATLLIFFFLMHVFKKRKFDGQIFLLLLIVYGIARSLLEFARGEPGFLGALTTAQFLNIPMIVVATVLYVYLFKKSN